MNDDWRLQIDLREDGYADGLIDRLDARELQDDLSEAFHDRVIVTRNGATVFLYAGDRKQAESARKLVEAYAQREEEDLSASFTRWHPLAAEWMPADEPLPDDAAERAAEHHARIAREREEVEEQGYPEWEVRVDFRRARRQMSLRIAFATRACPRSSAGSTCSSGPATKTAPMRWGS
ncbi:MAG TPA: hypothetical protein VN752_03000 [Solirubrobacterales bacterium]|nr:hypothetical protein [Solirubrobacterales bacterium]